MKPLYVLVGLIACMGTFACRSSSSLISVTRTHGNESGAEAILPALETPAAEAGVSGEEMGSTNYRTYSSLGSLGSGQISSGTQYRMTSFTVVNGNRRLGGN